LQEQPSGHAPLFCFERLSLKANPPKSREDSVSYPSAKGVSGYPSLDQPSCFLSLGGLLNPMSLL
jgi:hypothetical protein